MYFIKNNIKIRFKENKIIRYQPEKSVSLEVTIGEETV